MEILLRRLLRDLGTASMTLATLNSLRMSMSLLSKTFYSKYALGIEKGWNCSSPLLLLAACPSVYLSVWHRTSASCDAATHEGEGGINRRGILNPTKWPIIFISHVPI